MAYNLAELKEDLEKPPRICIYGGHGVGKTTLACGAEKPFLINLEDGIPRKLFGKVPNEIPTNYAECMDLLRALYTQDHGYKTVIIDTVDKLEVFMARKVCEENGWRDVSESPYRSANNKMSALWDNSILPGLDLLREKGMTIILLSHSKITQVKDPLLPEYDKHTPHLNKREMETVPDWCDVVGYAIVKTYTVSDGKRTLATTAGEHVILTHSNPAYTAKTRYEMPDEIPMVWSEMAKYLYPTEPQTTTKKTNKEN